MSLQLKLRAAAAAAAKEAALREKARILWLCDEIIRQTEAGLERKLMVERERHAAEVKLAIARNLVGTIRRAVLSDVRPAEDGEHDPLILKMREIEDAAEDGADAEP